MKYDANMTHLTLRVLCLLACMVSLPAVRYGDYSVARMPQYSDQLEAGDLALGHDEYSDKSPDAPAHLDYKYEEDPHGKSDDLPVKDIINENIWNNSIKKIRKPSVLRSDPIRDLDKYTLEEREPQSKSDKRIFQQRSEFFKGKYAKQSEFQRHLKRNSIKQRDDTDNVENNSDYVHKEDDDDAMEVSHYRYRQRTERKPRRKPRDRVLHQTDWADSNAKLEQEEMDARSDSENFEIKDPKKFVRLYHQGGIDRKNKNNYDYDEYYDMKRVQHMKSGLPALLRQSTVRTMEAKTGSSSGHWLNRRAESSSEHFVREPIVTELHVTSAITNTTGTMTTTATKTTPESKLSIGNSSDLSLSEKSRLSILKKAQKKESLRSVSSTTKPPVLMQVTRKMQTVVMVEPRSVESAMRARVVLKDSPERLQRARRLMRRKLVAGARSIHELTDNWDEMICDYIDVSLLDTDASSCAKINKYVASFVIITILIFYR